MKVFFYATHLFYTPHIETELELIQKHLNQGDTIFRVVCNAELSICDMNQPHELLTCLKCRDIRRAGKKLLDGNVNDLPIIVNAVSSDLRAINECKSVDDLKKIYFRNFDIGFAIVASLISINQDSEFNIQKSKDLINEYYQSALNVYLTTLKHIEKYKPDKIYFFNGRMAHVRAVMRACEAAKIDFVSHERGCDKDHYELTYNGLPHSIKYQLNQAEKYWNSSKHTNTEKESIGSQFYISKKRGNPKEWLSYTKDQNPELLPEQFDKHKKNIAIFNSSMFEFLAISSEWDYPFYKHQEQFISQILNMFESEVNYHFYLRVHPNLKGLENSQVNRISQLNFKNLTVIPADSKISSYHLLDNSDKVITFGSTMGIEAAFWGKPSILVGPCIYDRNLVYAANNYEEVSALIRADLSEKGKEGAIKYGYYNNVYGIKFDYFKPKTLFHGTFKNVDLMKSKSFLSRVLGRIYYFPFIGKPLRIYDKLFRKHKFKMRF